MSDKNLQIDDLWILGPLGTLSYGFEYTIFVQTSENICEHFRKSLFLEIYKSGFPKNGNVRKRAPTNDEGVSNRFMKISEMGPMSTWKHEMIFGKIKKTFEVIRNDFIYLLMASLNLNGGSLQYPTLIFRTRWANSMLQSIKKGNMQPSTRYAPSRSRIPCLLVLTLCGPIELQNIVNIKFQHLWNFQTTPHLPQWKSSKLFPVHSESAFPSQQ